MMILYVSPDETSHPRARNSLPSAAMASTVTDYQLGDAVYNRSLESTPIDMGSSSASSLLFRDDHTLVPAIA